jgi:MFS family permease
MEDDLAITGAVASLIGAAFFLGYFVLQIPGAIFAERRSVKTLIFWSLLAWGVLASLQGVLSSAEALIAVRFLLGLVEAAVLPAMVIFVSHWFTKPERGRANTILILGNPITVLWLTAISGFVIEAISWRGMFIVEGLPRSRGRSCSGRWSPTTRATRSGSTATRRRASSGRSPRSSAGSCR